MAWNQAEIDICQAALMILRQDIDLPTPGGADADNTLEWKKCKLVFKRAVNEVVDAYKWGNVTHGSVTEPIGAGNVQYWPEKLKNALVYCLARELAVPIAGRVADMRDCDALYRDKLLTAQLAVLNERLAENADPILAELIGNFRSDDPGLVKAYEVYTQRVAAVEANSVEAVAEILGIDLEEPAEGEKRTVDDLTGYAKDAAISHAVAKLAGACGLDANFVSLKNQQFEARLADAKREALQNAADSESSPEYTSALEEVKSTLEITGNVTDGLVKAAARALVYVRGGAKAGYDSNFVALKEQEYQAKIVEYRLRKLKTESITDSVLAQLVSAFRGEDAKLVNAWSDYSSRVASVKTLCENTVKAALGISSLDGVAEAAVNAMAVAKLAPAFGLDANFSALQMQQYDKLLSDARKIKLDASLASNTDPILAELLANFRSDDTGLQNTFDVYSKRVDTAKSTAEKEINVAHEWSNEFSAASDDHVAYPAFISLVVARLAGVCGLDVNQVQILEQKYQARLREARVNDLSKSLDKICDNFVLPFIFSTTKEDPSAGAQVAKIWKFSLGRSIFADTGYKVSAITIKCHSSVIYATNPVTLAVIAVNKTSGERTLIATSSNAARFLANQLVTWQFADFEIPENAYVECQFIDGVHTFDEIEAGYEESGWDFGKAYNYGVRLSPSIETSDKEDYAYMDQTATRRGVCPYVRVYSYEQGATSLYTVAQRVMRRVFPFVANGDTTPIPFSITQFANSVNEAAVAAENEVKATLGLSGLDALSEDAAECLATSHVAPVLGLDANFATIRLQEYQAKIQEYRKLRLNKALQENNDPVLGEILANFRSDDAALVNAFEIYMKRVDLVKSVAVQEINIAHEWHEGAFSMEATSHVAYPAYLALCAAKLVIACGLTGDAAKLYEARYQVKLREARIKDLEDTEIEDKVTKDVFALIRGNFAEDAALPRSIAALTNKIETLVPMARREVLSSHDWSFALEDMVVSSSENDHPDPNYRYHASLPGDCLTISAVYDGAGRVGQWKRSGDEIRSKTPISRIVYLRDMEEVKEYPAKVYRAFILRLVADLSKSLASSPKDRQYQEQLARDALNDAKMCDSRDSNTPDEAWGQNELADKMIWGSDDPLDRS